PETTKRGSRETIWLLVSGPPTPATILPPKQPAAAVAVVVPPKGGRLPRQNRRGILPWLKKRPRQTPAPRHPGKRGGMSNLSRPCPSDRRPQGKFSACKTVRKTWSGSV